MGAAKIVNMKISRGDSSSNVLQLCRHQLRHRWMNERVEEAACLPEYSSVALCSAVSFMEVAHSLLGQAPGGFARRLLASQLGSMHDGVVAFGNAFTVLAIPGPIDRQNQAAGVVGVIGLGPLGSKVARLL